MAASKQKPSWVRFALKLVCLAVCAGLVLGAISYMFIDGRNSITGNTMRDLYAQKQVDLIFLGSSTVYESCDPKIFDAELGVSAFNAATPAQTLRESYYQLKEACRLHEPKRVLLGVGPQHFMDRVERDSVSASYLFDNMRWSPVKAEFLADAFSPDYYPSALFPVVRLRAELTADDFTSAMRGHIAEMKGSAQSLESEGLRYTDKGYLANLEVIVEGTLPEAPPLGFSGADSVVESSLDYLSKIAAYCAKNDIELTLFQTPLLPGATEWIGDYAAYHDFIAGYAENIGVEFMDFNYLKPDIIAYEDGMFSDLEHTTEEFAQRFSKVFAGMLADGSAGTAANGAFFTDYGTYRDLYDAVASTWITEATKNKVSVASVGTAVPEYRITVFYDNEEMKSSTGWQQGDNAVFGPLEPGDYIVVVEARPQVEDDETEADEDGVKRDRVDLHVD